MENGPIFIGGMSRSGKTLMRFLLSSHPNLVFSRRTNMWTHFWGRYGNLSREENFERCLSAMMANKHVRLLRPDRERIRQEFQQGAPTYARLFALFHEQYARQEGKPRWGDQTELIERCADEVLTAYPEAKFIHMIRDPRDCCTAVNLRADSQRSKTGTVTACWNYSANLALKNHVRFPQRYKIVHYEMLVTQPERTVQEVCTFLGEAYMPTMLRLENVPRYHDHYAKTGQSPIKRDFVGQFQSALSKREVTFMQVLAGKTMAAHGYQCESVALDWRDQLALYFRDGPLQLAYMAAWRPRQLLTSPASVAAMNIFHPRFSHG